MERVKYISFRCSSFEKDFISTKAECCGLSLSNYVRQLALDHKPKSRMTIEEKKIFSQVTELKNNLQRIHNYFGNKQYKEITEENIKLIEELNKIINGWKRL